MNVPVTPRAHISLAAALQGIQTGQLVRRTDDAEQTYIFKHALVQDTAYASLTRHERRRLHQRVGEAYETMYADRCMDEFAALLAQHFGEAGDDAKTLTYALHAGDVAANAYANVEAIAFYTQALEAAKRGGAMTAQLIHLYTKRGRIYEVTGRDPDALATYQEMREYARANGDRVLELEALLLQGKLHSAPSVMFDRARALALAAEASALADELGNRQAQAKVSWNQLILEHYSGETSKAIRHGEQAMALARELDMRELLAYVLGDLARAYLNIWQMQRVNMLHAESLALWRALDNKPMLADNLMMSATQAMLRGDYDETIALTNEGIEISQAIESKLSLLSNLGTQQVVYLERGEFARALEIAIYLVRVSTELKLSFNGPLGYTFSAMLYGTMGAFERGAGMAQAAREVLQYPIPQFFRAWGWTMLALFYLDWGKPDEAEHALSAAQIEDTVRNGGPAAIFGTVALGRYLYARGDFENAAQRMAERAQDFQTTGVKMSLYHLLFIQAQAMHALGDGEKTLGILNQARELAVEMQARRVLWQIDAALSDIEMERGNVEQANTHHTNARSVLEFIVAHTPQEFRDAFLNLPRVREVWA